jgi:hypothetical protein
MRLQLICAQAQLVARQALLCCTPLHWAPALPSSSLRGAALPCLLLLLTELGLHYAGSFFGRLPQGPAELLVCRLQLRTEIDGATCCRPILLLLLLHMALTSLCH